MKQKDKLVSSLIIALVAGFIYYAFGESETIKRIPQFAYETVKSVIMPEEADPVITPEIEKPRSFADAQNIDNIETAEKTPLILEEAEYAQLPDLSMIMRLPNEGGRAFLSNKHLEKLEKIKELEHIRVLQDSYMQYAGIDTDIDPLDSGRFKIRVKIANMDSLNLYIDKSMSKLNESLSKLNEQLKNEDFLKNLPEVDTENIDIEVDVDEIKESVKESMKEFEESMKEFNFDMKEFKDSMKELKDSMKELKEKMKDMDSGKIKRMERKTEILES